MPAALVPRDPAFEARVHASFARQGIMTTIGARLLRVAPGEVDIELRVNLLAPARGDRFIARAHVVTPGRTLTVCAADVAAVRGGAEAVVATMLGTLMALYDRPDLPPGR